MNLQKFPFETQDPVVENVMLPVGVHVLKLTVTDDTNTMSLPDRVVVTVQPMPKPFIHHLLPDHLRKGEETEAVIHGEHLTGVTSIKVFRDTHEDDYINVTTRPGGTDDRLPVTIKVMEHARAGTRTLVLTTPGGTATVKFVVVSMQGCRIHKITPTWSHAGMTRPIAVRIDGDNMDAVTEVTFLRNNKADQAIQAKIRGTQQDFVDIDLTISSDAEFDQRTLSLNTLAGPLTSPPGVIFTVAPGYLAQLIMLLTLITALIHLTLNFPDLLFILNGLGYLALLVALYAPLAWPLTNARSTLRWVMVGYAALTIIIWIAIGARTPLAYFTKVVEVILAALLIVESLRSRREGSPS